MSSHRALYLCSCNRCILSVSNISLTFAFLLANKNCSQEGSPISNYQRLSLHFFVERSKQRPSATTGAVGLPAVCIFLQVLRMLAVRCGGSSGKHLAHAPVRRGDWPRSRATQGQLQQVQQFHASRRVFVMGSCSSMRWHALPQRGR